MSQVTYGFIGAGRMATALAGGLVHANLARGSQIVASDPSEEVRQRFAVQIAGAQVAVDNADVARHCDIVVLAVKPQRVDEAVASFAAALDPGTLVVSIAAGVTLGHLETQLPAGTRVVRVMPNTPCLIGRGASGYSLGSQATAEDGRRVAELLEAVGIAYELPESLLDGVTGLSGSGPAFVYTVIEALSDGGVLAGLPREVAARLAAQTVAGAAEMVLQSEAHPAELRDAVTSPGGTTIAGLEALERGGLRSALLAAVKAATLRSQELGHSSM